MNAGAVPSSTGAFAVKELVSTHEQWDISELVGGVDSEPQEAADLAKDLSRLTREGVVLLTADLATDAVLKPGYQARSPPVATKTVKPAKNSAPD